MNNTFKKRIDELGRIVIPKQIRNTFKIKDFDELELFIEEESIVIKKTGGISLIKDKLDNFLKYIKKYDNIDAFIIDNNDVISSNIVEVNGRLSIDFNSFLNNYEYIELNVGNHQLKGYIKTYQLIYDSNNYGSVVFVLKEKIIDNSILSDIVNVLLDFIR